MQEVSHVYTSPFLDKDEQKIALRARKTSVAFEKRATRTSLSESKNASIAWTEIAQFKKVLISIDDTD